MAIGKQFYFLLVASLLAASEAQASNNGAASDTNPIPVNTIELAQGDAAPSTPNLAAASTSVASQSESGGSDEWEVAIVPYLWASGMKVDVTTPQGEDVEVDESFTDILDALKFVFMGAVDARKGRFVTVTDLMFLSMESEGEGQIGPGLIESEVDTKLLVTTALAGYRVVDEGPMFFDLMGGARISSLEVDLDLSGPLQTVERESSETKISPIIASRFRVPLGDRWGLAVYGDLGGFGITADISWQLMGTIQYDLSDHWRALAGWRHFEAHQDKEGFDIDLALDGPFLTVAYRF